MTLSKWQNENVIAAEVSTLQIIDMERLKHITKLPSHVDPKNKILMLAMIRLAREYGKGTLLINQIAESERIPKRFLEAILLELKIMATWKQLGKNGGYYLLKKPERNKPAGNHKAF